MMAIISVTNDVAQQRAQCQVGFEYYQHHLIWGTRGPLKITNQHPLGFYI